MALKTAVIVNSITNLSDARYCAGMGVEMLGFDLYETSASYVQPQTFRVITEWVAGVKTVGELPQAEATDLEKLLAVYTIDYLQVAHSGDWKNLRSVGVPLICNVDCTESFDAASFERQYNTIATYVDFFLLQFPAWEQVHSATWLELVNGIAGNYPVLIGADMTGSQIENLLAETKIKGIALKGSQEIRPGLKDFDDLASILELLETEE